MAVLPLPNHPLSLITEALSAQQWQPIDDIYQYTAKHAEYMGIPQPWMLLYSKAAAERAKKIITKHYSSDVNRFFP
ncbi:hypothetical protein EMM73_02340 [Rheinheimera sediminis]|uniref:hypothetical protein n=1 Tax=Rheinheimera sp. YQF-1 TaxID=2499626 RepID=UPI000FDB37A0|nr:hypothetical protein [Rheinheimera sp. YQF-1]RVT48153.1 hypothetical protein EMM73_02340 [Rheinheimera sp. YQF-1]